MTIWEAIYFLVGVMVGMWIIITIEHARTWERFGSQLAGD